MEIFGEHFGFAFKATTYNNMIVAIRTFEQFEKKMRISFHLKKEYSIWTFKDICYRKTV